MIEIQEMSQTHIHFTIELMSLYNNIIATYIHINRLINRLTKGDLELLTSLAALPLAILAEAP